MVSYLMDEKYISGAEVKKLLGVTDATLRGWPSPSFGQLGPLNKPCGFESA
jgi:hypothetical protein